ncbi:AI-2E family transporter [Deinococcus sp. KSM4-11]|uniref:AI-2E family transporter n=1 Tax=Deinococcus sp. KSM4-11 TaxID=2568654 RepID=UPI0010A4A499|nr:AI-2E family transporter [Deinococcus sp. KSM4-11]THF85114.1 AI-2E family transporter [Deinococcus sp. KSM4-11]
MTADPHLATRAPSLPEPPVAPPSTWARLWRWPLFQLAVYLLLAWTLWRVVGHVHTVVINTLVAYLLANLANPLLSRLERRGTPRPLGILLLVLVFFGILAMISPLVSTLVREVQALITDAPKLLNNLNETLRRLSARSALLASAQQQFDAWVKVNQQDLPGRLSKSLGTILAPDGAVFSGVKGAFGLLGQGFITLVIAIYMMAIYPSIGPFLVRLLPLRFQPLARDVGQHVGRAVGGYFRGQITVALILGVLIAGGLTILGVPSGLAIGFLAALLNIVPYLGVILSVIPALLLAIPLGGLKVALVAALFLAANQLEGHVIAPRVVSHSTNLSSLAVLLAIVFGVETFGLMGAVIAVPLVAMLKSLLEAYYYSSRAYRAQNVTTPAMPSAPTVPVVVPSDDPAPEQVTSVR